MSCLKLQSTPCHSILRAGRSSPYVGLVHQGVDQLQRTPPDADVSVLHAVNNGGAVALHSLRVNSHNLTAAATQRISSGAYISSVHGKVLCFASSIVLRLQDV
jgi:hypothetical protein